MRLIDLYFIPIHVLVLFVSVCWKYLSAQLLVSFVSVCFSSLSSRWSTHLMSISLDAHTTSCCEWAAWRCAFPLFEMPPSPGLYIPVGLLG